ncbi:MAG: hypothetical protein A3K68_01130 [Euryarchaeota archaeon RBG_16_68_13]|nr:MAG: hypothetical protein A3K68_01130 [Euryarchaeota archaeon RBG_16_68_13]
MKVFLSVDMEGVCGVVNVLQTDPDKGGRAYEESCRLMTGEANAAIEGCLDAGATEILVADSHWNFTNLIPEDLHEAAILLRGTPRPFSMVQGLDASFAAAMFVGYHAAAGTPHAIIDHTYTGRIRDILVNGSRVNETGLNAYLAGHHRVPVVLVTGDAQTAAQARRLIAGVHTVAVKEATARFAAANLHPRKAREAIRAEAAKALADRARIRPLRAKTPVTISVDFTQSSSADLAELVPGTRRRGGTKVEFTARDFVEGYRTFVALLHASRE